MKKENQKATILHLDVDKKEKTHQFDIHYHCYKDTATDGMVLGQGAAEMAKEGNKELVDFIDSAAVSAIMSQSQNNEERHTILDALFENIQMITYVAINLIEREIDEVGDMNKFLAMIRKWGMEYMFDEKDEDEKDLVEFVKEKIKKYMEVKKNLS